MEHHRAVVTAAGLPGVVDGPGAIDAADDALLEVAALLAGRPPRTGAQRRFVASRVAALVAITRELTERHEAWVTARAEVDRIAFPLPPEEPTAGRARPGLLVAAFVVILFLAFFAWDLVRASGRALIALLDGLALRLVTIGTTVGRAIRHARTTWRHVRTGVVAAAVEACRRVRSLRWQIRLAMRRRRRRGVRGERA